MQAITTITLCADALRLALPHVSREESRPILNGLLVESTGVVVAANGATFAAVEDAAWADDDRNTRPHADVIVRFHKPRETTAKRIVRVEIDIDGTVTSGIVARLYGHVGQVGVTLVDIVEGPFPNWRQVVPTGDGEAIREIGFKLDDVGDRFAGWGPIRLTFGKGPDAAVIVTAPDNPGAFGLWMPARVLDRGAFTLPAFVQRRSAPATAPVERDA